MGTLRKILGTLRELRDQADSAANEVPALQGKQQKLKAKAINVTEAIAAISHSPSLLAQLSSIETEIAKLDDRLAEMNQPRDLAVSMEDLWEVSQRLLRHLYISPAAMRPMAGS